MSAKQSLRKRFIKKQESFTGKPFSLLNKPYLLGLISFIILAALFSGLIYQQYLFLKESQNKEAYDVANAATDKLQQSLANSLSATKLLSFFVDHNGHVSNFDSVASQIFGSGTEIDALQLVPGGVIRYVYPLKGNEAVIGYDILKDSLRNKEAYKAIEKRELYFAGPFALRQGGTGVVGRLPIYRDNNFWGFSAVVIKMPTLLKAAGIDTTGNKGYHFQLSKVNPDTKKEEFFIRQSKDISGGRTVTINVPNGDWKLSVTRETSLLDLNNIYLFILFGSLFSLLGALFIFHVARRPKKLDELVQVRTRQLKESEEKFSKAFHSNLLGFAIYDRDFRIMDVNEPFAILLEQPREKLIGKKAEEAGLLSKINVEKRDAVSREIEQQLNIYGYLENFEAVIETSEGEQQTLLLSIEQLELNGNKYWLSSAIDITANKKAELLLKESEEKYRNLVEQASDGIVITDLDGFILEVNNSVCHMSGYKNEEMLGQHLSVFLPEKEIKENPLRINELLQGKALMYERSILRKDGSLLDIEVNSKMASSHTLIGFIRDISERKKNEKELLYHSRLLEGVSDAITSLDMNRCIVSWNKACEDLYGFTYDEVIGKRIPELVTFEYPGTSNEEVFKQVFSEGQWRGEFNFIHPKTKVKTCLLSGVSLLKSGDGEKIGFIITSRDITAQKTAQRLIEESEEKYRTLVEQATDGIFIADKQGHFLVVNSSGYKMSQYSAEELSTMSIYDLVLPEDLENNPFHFTEMLGSEGARAERRLKRKDGSLLDVEVSAKFISGDRFLAFVRDLSDRKKAEEEIRRTNERFEIIAQATNDAVWDHDFITNKTWGNKKLYSLYGFGSQDEKIDFEMFIERIHPDERQGIIDRLNKAIERSESSIAEEFHFKSANGEYKTFYDRGFIKYDDYGKPERILGAMQDITEREINKRQVIREKELSDSIINGLPGIFYLFNKKGNLLRWNKNFEAVTGYTGDEISHMNALDFFAEKDHGLLRLKGSSVFKKGEDNTEAELVLKNREVVPYYFTGLAIEYEGEKCLLGVGLDFSEREKSAKALKESEERLRFSLKAANQGLYDLNVQTGEAVVNDQYAMIMGYDPATFRESNSLWLERLHPDDHDATAKAYKDYVEGITEHYKIEFRQRTKDNGWKWILSIGKIVEYDKDGKPLRMMGTHTDITERKKAEEEILAAKMQFQNLVENISGVYWVNDLDTVETLYISPSYETIWGQKAEDLYKNPASFLDAIHPDDRPIMEEALKDLALTRDSNRSFRIIRPDGETRWILAKTNVITDTKGNNIEYGYAEDITERKRYEEELLHSEQKYRLLFYNNPLPMWMVTIPDLNIIDVNDAAIKQYGYTREEFLKLSTKDLRPAEDVENFLKEVDMMQPGVINIRAWRHKRKDGTIINVETYSHQILYEGRMVWLGLSHDVTEQYHAKRLLQKSYDEIRMLASNLQSIREDERTNIAREIHDELGQQLTGLKMDMHWLNRKINSTEETVNKKMKDSIELINSTIATVRKIATDLRPSILDDLGLQAALEWQSEEFERRSDTKVIFCNKAGEISVLPEAATALFRIYQEVLTNIARHANASQVDASLFSDENWLYFSIRDNGVGFEVNNIKEKKTLGLLGIKERSLLIGGAYEIKSKPGQGSEILISIPLEYVKNN